MVDGAPMAPKNKKILLYGGGTVGLAFALFAYRKSKGSAAVAPAYDTSATDPAYDTSADSLDTGYSGIAQGASYYDPSTGATIGTGTGFTPSTNASWFQAAEAYLVSQGYDGQAVGDALGRAISGTALDDTQYGILQAAIGSQGAPPQGIPTVSHANNNGQGQTGAVANKYISYVRNDVDGAIYGIDSGGVATHLTPQDYAALGSPGFSGYHDPTATLAPAK